MTLARTPLLLAALTAPAPACGTFSGTTDASGSETGAGTGSDSDTPTGGAGETVTVYDIQMGKITVDIVVEVKDVVVTSPIYYDKKTGDGNFFTSEAAGGPFSGIQVHAYADVVAELGAGGALPKVGDKITLRAMYGEFFDASQLTLSTAADLTPGGAGVVPAPSVVTAGEVTTGGDRKSVG